MVGDEVIRAWVWVCKDGLSIDEAGQTSMPIAYQITSRRAVEVIATTIDKIIAR
jgi:hypothetical protein